jgi:hypothetical protein
LDPLAACGATAHALHTQYSLLFCARKADKTCFTGIACSNFVKVLGLFTVLVLIKNIFLRINYVSHVLRLASVYGDFLEGGTVKYTICFAWYKNC